MVHVFATQPGVHDELLLNAQRRRLVHCPSIWTAIAADVRPNERGATFWCNAGAKVRKVSFAALTWAKRSEIEQDGAMPLAAHQQGIYLWLRFVHACPNIALLHVVIVCFVL